MSVPIKRGEDQKISIDMTPMIDIVFQLLSFFIFTLRISAQEGDFMIKMPLNARAAGTPDPDQTPPIKIRLRAGTDGSCQDIIMNDRSFGGGIDGFKRLHQEVASLVGDGSLTSEAEVELDCDYNLKYENVIRVITAVSGERQPNGDILKMIEKIKFSPPKPPPIE
ncbi:MAG TPA: biopolymer transporter ExbD [Pirellulaceae bacterium]|nr:biopolymer transporter ExbD [Pirellulaceae bacterium]